MSCSSFRRKPESSAFSFNSLKALDPSFRWDDEQNQTIPKDVTLLAVYNDVYQRIEIMNRKSLFIIIIGLIIYLSALAYQIGVLRRFVPSEADFIRTTSVTGIYSYEKLGRSTLTRIDNKLLYCRVDYHGEDGSCYADLKGLPNNSKITASLASINTTDGHVSWTMSISSDGQEIYGESPEQALHDWWFASRFEALGFPLNFLEAYCLILMLILILRVKSGK